MRIIIEASKKESKEICESDNGAQIIVDFIKEEIKRIEEFEGDMYKSSISIRTV